MKRFVFVVIVLLASASAVILRVIGARLGPLVDAAIFGAAILAAGFLLSWSAEAAERHIAQGLVLAVVALITVLPEYFAEAMVGSVGALGITEFVLIQWLAPLASEAPPVTIAILFGLAGRAAVGLATVIDDKINLWTLLVSMLPLVMSIGYGTVAALPLDARQTEEFLLTAGQSLFALLVRLSLAVLSALALATLFIVQISFADFLRGDEARTIASLTVRAWVYLGLAATLFFANARLSLELSRFAAGPSAGRLSSTRADASKTG